MEHQADLIAIAHDIRLKQRRPINLDDRELVANNYSRFHGWMSGGSNANARQVLSGPTAWTTSTGAWAGPARRGASASMAWAEARRAAPRASTIRPSAICRCIPSSTTANGSSISPIPLTVKLERERAFASGCRPREQTGRAEMDFADWWDKWPGQFDPFMSALETYHAGGLPWREAIDQKAPRRVVRSNMQPVDHSYGIVDICRISEDADHGYETGVLDRSTQTEFTGLFTESVLGSANRFFYNGRVFWNDGDGFHIYKFNLSDGQDFTCGQAKVDANFHAIAGNTLFVSEAFDVPYPADRIELLKRISPPTMDVSYPVDLFVRKPAHVWNMPVERPFGKWNVAGGLQFHRQGGPRQFTATLDAAKDLRLDPDKEYIVYEFWTQATDRDFKGTFDDASGQPLRLRHLQHRREAGPSGADLHQPACPADGVRHQGPGLRRRSGCCAAFRGRWPATRTSCASTFRTVSRPNAWNCPTA